MNFKKLNLSEVNYYTSTTEIQNNTPFISIGNNVLKKLNIFSVKTLFAHFPFTINQSKKIYFSK